jgi:branched-chain amino acid transport system substrate-binding protein
LALVVSSTLAVAQEAKIRIGAAISITGRTAKEGTLVKKGYDTWAEWINERGGMNVGGKTQKVEMIYYDDKGDATTSAKLTEKLITEDKVNFILGPFSSGITAATSMIGEKYGYVTISASGNSDFLYERGLKYLFSIMPVASQDMVPIAELAVQQTPKPKTFAVVVWDNVFTLPALEGAKKRSLDLGLKEAYYGKYPANTTDFSGILTVLKSMEIDLLYFGGFFQDTVSFLRQAKELDVNAKLYATPGSTTNPDWVPVMKKDGDYILSTLPWSKDMSYNGRFFSTKSYTDFWRNKYGDDPDDRSARGFAAGILMQLAVEKAGRLDQTKIRDALRSLEVETFLGKFKFDEKGMNIAGHLGVLQVQNGQGVLVYPPRPGAKLLYPVPTWKQR